MRHRDILLLPFLRAATDQNHKAVAILAEIDAETWAEVDFVFKDTEPNAPDLGEVPLLHAGKRDRHFGGSGSVESVEPLGKSFVSAFVDVAAEFDHPETMVTDLLPLVKHCGST
jgi:hypothetical protein